MVIEKESGQPITNQEVGKELRDLLQGDRLPNIEELISVFEGFTERGWEGSGLLTDRGERGEIISPVDLAKRIGNSLEQAKREIALSERDFEAGDTHKVSLALNQIEKILMQNGIQPIIKPQEIWELVKRVIFRTIALEEGSDLIRGEATPLRRELPPPTDEEVTADLGQAESLGDLNRLMYEYQQRGWKGIQGTSQLYTPNQITEQINQVYGDLYQSKENFDISAEELVKREEFSTITRTCGLREAVARIISNTLSRRTIYPY